MLQPSITHIPGTIICGAGVIGLTIARELLLNKNNPKPIIILLDRNTTFGQGVSSRNSEVIHAGLYYDKIKQPLKTTFCVQGRKLLTQYCQQKQIPYQNTGKLVVATDSNQQKSLLRLYNRAIENGLLPQEEIELISQQQAQKLEPELSCIQALHVKCTSILNVHDFMSAIENDLHSSTGIIDFSYKSNVKSVQFNQDGKFQLVIQDLTSLQENIITCDSFINAAGLSAIEVAHNTFIPTNLYPNHDFYKPKSLPTHYAKGNYFKIAGGYRHPKFSHLIYPIPEQHGLGIHLTIDVNGGYRFGPNVEWISAPTSPQDWKTIYVVNPKLAETFYDSIRRYWPHLQDNSLEPDFAGIRPKLVDAQQNAVQDFHIWTPKQHGVPGLIHLLGIESPGLTSSLAIAKYVVDQL
jgi:L-2-hydroxyglutarate oxidase LhgO